MSSEGPAPLHIGSVSVGVASVRVRGFLWLKFLRGPTCALHAWWTLALYARGHWNRVFLRWPALQLGHWRGSRGPLRLLRDRGGLSSRSNRTSIASGGTRTSELSSRSQADCSVAGSRLEPSAWSGGSDSPREAIPPRVNRNALGR